MHQRNVRITCRKVERCLVDNCRWQPHQLWSQPGLTSASSPSPPFSFFSSPSPSPPWSPSNPFSLDHPFFRHYFGIRSSFCHSSSLPAPFTDHHWRWFGQFSDKGSLWEGPVGLQPCSTLENFLVFKILVPLWISELPSCNISWFIAFNISGCLSGRLLNHFGFEDD